MKRGADAFEPIELGSPMELPRIPDLGGGDFAASIVAAVGEGWRISALFGMPPAGEGVIRLYALLSHDEENRLRVGGTLVEGEGFPSIAGDCPQAQLFEREIAEQFGLVPKGHPWMKPVRYRPSWTARDAWGRDRGRAILPGVGDFYRVEGEQVHEVAVGPVHAGIIEPGHFRFQCHGEEVFHLEIALGYQHRGVEEALIGGPDPRSRHLAETLSGDSTVAHSLAYVQALEALAPGRPGARAQALRGVALELERLANHTGDLGALAGDVGFLPTASFCGRIRGDFLNMTALLCGNRFGRDMVRPGGPGFDLDEARTAELLKRLAAAERDATGAIELLWENQSVMARFEDRGRLSRETATELGLVGPAARASGLARDVRFNQPSGIYRMAQIPVATGDSGDVFARAYVRWLEIQRSVAFIRELLGSLPAASAPREGREGRELAPACMAVGLQEGWRGEVCHVAVTGAAGKFARYKVVDPSFHNWSGLAYALRGEEISDFPLCNKSFNLSYCGHDL